MAPPAQAVPLSLAPPPVTHDTRSQVQVPGMRIASDPGDTLHLLQFKLSRHVRVALQAESSHSLAISHACKHRKGCIDLLVMEEKDSLHDQALTCSPALALVQHNIDIVRSPMLPIRQCLHLVAS